MMSRNYRAHAIPKSTPGEYRIVHEFNDVSAHRDDLELLRSKIRELSMGYNQSMRINLRGSVHGYPMGNPSMIDLIKSFHDNGGFRPTTRILCSFDLKNFFHSVRPYHVLGSTFSMLYGYCEKAFVDIGNGIVILSQGSPLSQDVSNIVLSKTDIRCMSLCKSLNDHFGSDLRDEILEVGARAEKARMKRSTRERRSLTGSILRRDRSAFQHVLDRCKQAASSVSGDVVRVRYMRYVDNVHLICDFSDGFDKDKCASFAKSLSEAIRSVFTSAGFRINVKKTNYFSSCANRRMPILGLNTTARVKCKRHYIDGVRAGLHNWVYDGMSRGDLSPSVMSSAVYVLQSDFRSISRLNKQIDKIRAAVDGSPGFFANAEALVRFVDRKTEELNSIEGGNS